MYLVIAETGEQGSRKMLPLVLLDAPDESQALDKLEALLQTNGIKTERYLSRWLKWQHTIFSVREIRPEDDLKRMLVAVRAAEEQEVKSQEDFARVFGL
jgi:hypothetical protein